MIIAVREWTCRDFHGVVHEVMVTANGQVTTWCHNHYFWTEDFSLVARKEYERQLVSKTTERVSCLFCLERRL